MIVGKAPVLQKAGLAAAFLPVAGRLVAEATTAKRGRELMEIGGFLERGGDLRLGEARTAHVLLQATRPVTPFGMAAYELRSETLVVEQALVDQFREGGGDGLGFEAIIAQSLAEILDREVAALETLQCRDARRFGITRGGGIDLLAPPPAERAPDQLSLSLSAPLLSGAFFGASSFARTCCSMSRAISGCSFRKLRVLSLP